MPKFLTVRHMPVAAAGSVLSRTLENVQQDGATDDASKASDWLSSTFLMAYGDATLDEACAPSPPR